MLEIDGSFGEGGGQVLRTALSLSCLLVRPFRIKNIRKGRQRPGLRPQHLTSVRAAASISGAEVQGDREGSAELVFRPGSVSAGNYRFDIGTAGSVGLVFQTLLAPLAFAGGSSVVSIRGGTHVPLAPSFDYLAQVFLPALRRLGLEASAEIASYGFYPKGGGEAVFSVRPVPALRAWGRPERGALTGLKGISAVSNLPMEIARRQRDAMLSALGGLPAEVEAVQVSSVGTGTFAFLRADFEGSVAGFTSLGKRGKRAEAVGEEAARGFLEFYGTGAFMDEHLADQVSLYLSLSEGESELSAPLVSEHLLTNMYVLGLFLGTKYDLVGHGRMRIWGRGLVR